MNSSNRKREPFRNLEAAAVFDSYPRSIRAKLMSLRQLIFDTAYKNRSVGELEETLKWGQPGYLTPQTKSGSTVRIDKIKGDDSRYAMYFHCQTNLVETFRELYSKDFKFEGNRAIIFNIDDVIPVKKLAHCIELALTYHLNRRRDVRK
jgi:hypothetical protein